MTVFLKNTVTAFSRWYVFYCGGVFAEPVTVFFLHEGGVKAMAFLKDGMWRYFCWAYDGMLYDIDGIFSVVMALVGWASSRLE